MPDNPLGNHGFSRTTFARYWKEITAPSGALDPIPKALWMNGAGTVTAMDASGTATAITVGAAGLVPIAEPAQVTALTGATLVGLYDANPH